VARHRHSRHFKTFVYTASRIRDSVRSRAIAKQDLSEAVVNSIITGDRPPKQEDATAAVPYAEILAQFEQDLRGSSKQNAKPIDYLELADRLRDVHLWNAGVYLEDRTNAPAMVRPVDARLHAEREQKEAIARQKTEAKQKREREQAKLAEQAKLSPKDMFRTEEYSTWDDDGVPTKDKEGADLPKSKAKKLRKEWERQKRFHEEHQSLL
jgi:cysteinyl-tRNA synthetase